MDIQDFYETHFPMSVQNRGLEIVMDDEFEQVAEDPDSFEMQCSDGETVKLVRVENRALHGQCTCMAARGNAPCKHMWAAFVYLDGFESDFLLPVVLPFVNDSRKVYGSGKPIAVSLESKSDEDLTWKDQVRLLEARVMPVPQLPLVALDIATLSIAFIVHAEMSLQRGGLVVEPYSLKQESNGQVSSFKKTNLGAVAHGAYSAKCKKVAKSLLRYLKESDVSVQDSLIPIRSDSVESVFLPLLATGSVFISRGREPARSIYSRGCPLNDEINSEFAFAIQLMKVKNHYRIGGYVYCEARQIDLAEVCIVLPNGFLFTQSEVFRLSEPSQINWALRLKRAGDYFSVPQSDKHLIARMLLQFPDRPRIDLPEDFSWGSQKGIPQPILRVEPIDTDQQTLASALFDYEGQVVFSTSKEPQIINYLEKKLVDRDFTQESFYLQQLQEFQFDLSQSCWEIKASQLGEIVKSLKGQGWLVEATNIKQRTATISPARVSTGFDWFELEMTLNFDGFEVGLPQILRAIKSKKGVVYLDDGSEGLLPEDWLASIAPLLSLGTVEEESLRFKRSQANLLGTIIDDLPQTKVDIGFSDFRKALAKSKHLKPVQESEKFKGTLRPYQREGLAWLEYLNQIKFGGCLADEMGLGKTIQILALLDKQLKRGRQALIVVPRSLVFNWMEEIAKFTGLSVFDYSKGDRRDSEGKLSDYDIIVTTYAIMRSDIEVLEETDFHYAILDEAQAIKNASSKAAKAALRLRATHRICATGTPIENSLGELWSQFSFINPGFLGEKSIKRFASNDQKELSPDSIRILSQAIRPFLLRRTKSEVLKDLPEKVEAEIHCKLPAHQRDEYDQLQTYYRNKVLEAELSGSPNKSFIILEGLTRLRQAACHPGLIDSALLGMSSAKIDLLKEKLDEVGDSKVLIFSQFTSMLKIVKGELDRLGYTYEYLDGSTGNRQKKVERFQSDDDCQIFLISLKAGGTGLNLTKAEYCIILDPWWNPAAESQAIDRAHRIGQKNKVIAYKFVAKGTVEEKVLKLQQQKKKLAQDVLGGGDSGFKDLTKEEVMDLFS